MSATWDVHLCLCDVSNGNALSVVHSQRNVFQVSSARSSGPADREKKSREGYVAKGRFKGARRLFRVFMNSWVRMFSVSGRISSCALTRLLSLQVSCEIWCVCGDLRFVSSTSEVLLLRFALRSDWDGGISSTSSVGGGGATTIITRPGLNTYLIEQKWNLPKTVFPFPSEQVRFSMLRQRDVPLPFP